MALLRLCTTLLLFSLFFIHQAESDNLVILLNAADAPAPPPPHLDCDGACAVRCQLSSRPRICKRACGTCCARCDCVPPGTSGNYDACPCYANMTTHGGRHKCP
ncbi:gibberellin-regulated protein 11-like [Rhodamnia argentea]|uniref:Gibberellin-regulated protein 11-like n=1 Tax=Rhodamnia argentea TaxID=178133 RepID=A0A8B8Q534_9MYRT|nr:gibberellin-regulated protein 11-like [Rhodamnia argentea]